MFSTMVDSFVQFLLFTLKPSPGGGGGGGAHPRKHLFGKMGDMSANCFHSRQNMEWIGGKELKYLSSTDLKVKVMAKIWRNLQKY